MKIMHLDLPSGTTDDIPFLIGDRWTTEQATAGFELLDDLHAQIWRHYGPRIQQRYLEDRVVDSPPLMRTAATWTSDRMRSNDCRALLARFQSQK